MRSVHRLFFMILAVVAPLVFHPSNGGAEPGALRTRKPPLEQLVLPLPHAPETLNPYLAWDQTEKLVNGLIYESLLTVDPTTGELSPGLAVQWAVDGENLVYTFRLKPGVRWQDGVAFTADDVVFSFEKMLDPETDSAHLRSYYQDIEEVLSSDGQTVQIRLRRPYYLALRALGGLPIIPKHLFSEGDFNLNPHNFRPLGTGPYKFTSRPGDRVMILQGNENYHGPPPEVSRIVFPVAGGGPGGGGAAPDLVAFDPLNWVMAGSSTRYSCTREGPVPPVFGESHDGAIILNMDGGAYHCLPPRAAGISMVMLNLNKPFFWDRKVRVAMAHLMDRERMLNTVLLGYGRPVESGLSLEETEYGGELKPRGYDLRKAQRLLSEAGWEDRDADGVREKGSIALSFRLYAEEGWGTGLKMAAIVEEAASRAGIRIGVEKVSREELLARLRNGAYEAALLRLETAPYTDPYQFWHSSQAGKGYNFSRFVSAEADYLLERARLEEEDARRSKYYVRLQQVIHDEVPAIFLFSHQALLGVSTRLKEHGLSLAEIFPLLSGAEGRGR